MRYTVRMRPVLAFFIVSLLYLFLLTSPALAIEIATDPQYVIMNFATINELNWATPEAEWNQDIKPAITAQIKEMRSALESASGESRSERLLGWSTLMEYMNFPLDEPGPNSVYAIKTRRILEIADELNFPVFLPLNGFQWWDQLPELYNWWDPDGTHTDPAFFARQKNPDEFKARFVRGYNPDNKWNVEWQDWKTPMKLNYRNWGGGGFRLAPPPNLGSTISSPNRYRQVLNSRLKIILTQILPFLTKWQSEGRLDLFAGISLGTEISLNASTRPHDEFLPYGWRAIQDRLCPSQEPTCGGQTHFSSSQINTAREQAVAALLLDLSRWATIQGIPKERIYTHVWGEVKVGEPRYVDYPSAAYTLYSRPGMSFYGYSQDPLSLPTWKAALKANGLPSWGAVEYSAGKSAAAWNKGLKNTLENPLAPAKIVVIYNWQEHKGTGAISALRSFLSRKVTPTNCASPLLLPTLDHHALRPTGLTWKVIGTIREPLTLHIKKGIKIGPNDPDVFSTPLELGMGNLPLPFLPSGTYTWYIETQGCNQNLITSEPRDFIHVPTPTAPIPRWVNGVLDFSNQLSNFVRAMLAKSP